MSQRILAGAGRPGLLSARSLEEGCRDTDSYGLDMVTPRRRRAPVIGSSEQRVERGDVCHLTFAQRKSRDTRLERASSTSADVIDKRHTRREPTKPIHPGSVSP